MQDEDSATEDSGYFNIPRARLRLDGFAWYPWLKYKIQYDFTGNADLCPSGGSGCDPTLRRPDLRDLYFDVTRAPWSSVRFGQFKAPFGQQELTSSGNQEFVDRSIASERFAPSRQQGVMLYGASFKRVFGYEGGLFNGNARNKNANDNPGYMYVLRLHLDHNYEEMDKLSEAATDNPQVVKWTVGAAYMYNTIEQSLATTAEELEQDTFEGFFALKYKRLFVLADYYARTVEQTAPGPDIDLDGFNAQVGLFVVPSRIEVALRYSEVDPDKDLEDDSETEARIGFGWYFSAHDLKFQADYGQLQNDSKAPAEDTQDIFRAQVQIVF
jgi:hypothetical protein